MDWQAVFRAWSRRTRWTPLLLSQRELQRSLTKERLRVDRGGGLFGFIILRLENPSGARSQTRQLAKLLHRRLRLTDEKGHLGLGRLGVILPATGPVATQSVLRELLRLARGQGLLIDGEAFVYPDQDRDGGTPGPTQRRPEEAVQPATAAMAAEYPSWKRLLDVAGASTGLILGAPLLVGCAALVKLSSPGPLLFCQQRTGYLGRSFTIYKFRSMVAGAEQMQAELRDRNERDGPAFKLSDDPRITLAAALCGPRGWTNCPSCSTSCVATWRWWVRGRCRSRRPSSVRRGKANATL